MTNITILVSSNHPFGLCKSNEIKDSTREPSDRTKDHMNI